MAKERERTLNEILADQDAAINDPVKRYKAAQQHEASQSDRAMYMSWLRYGAIAIFVVSAAVALVLNLGAMLQAVGGIVGVALLIGGYFLPSIIAKSRKHHQYDPILLINIFLGWTLLGWFVALVWSVSAVRKG